MAASAVSSTRDVKRAICRLVEETSGYERLRYFGPGCLVKFESTEFLYSVGTPNSNCFLVASNQVLRKDYLETLESQETKGKSTKQREPSVKMVAEFQGMKIGGRLERKPLNELYSSLEDDVFELDGITYVALTKLEPGLFRRSSLLSRAVEGNMSSLMASDQLQCVVLCSERTIDRKDKIVGENLSTKLYDLLQCDSVLAHNESQFPSYFLRNEEKKRFLGEQEFQNLDGKPLGSIILNRDGEFRGVLNFIKNQPAPAIIGRRFGTAASEKHDDAPECMMHAGASGGIYPLLDPQSKSEVGTESGISKFVAGLTGGNKGEVSSVDPGAVGEGEKELQQKKDPVKHGTPTDDELEELGDLIGSKWKKLGRRLDARDQKLQEIDTAHVELSEKGYHMLKHWRQEKGSAATYQALCDALQHKLVQRQDLAEKFCYINEFTDGKQSPMENSCRSFRSFQFSSSNKDEVEQDLKGEVHVVDLPSKNGSKEEPGPVEHLRHQTDDQSVHRRNNKEGLPAEAPAGETDGKRADAKDVLLQDRSGDRSPQGRGIERRSSFPPDLPQKDEHPQVKRAISVFSQLQPAGRQSKFQLDSNNEASRDEDSVSGHEHHNQEINAATAGRTEAPNLNEEATLPAAAIGEPQNPVQTAPTHQDETNLESLTGTPIQVEAEDTVDEGVTGNETAQQPTAAANSYDHLLVSGVMQKDKFVKDKLAPQLDHTSNRAIKTWEHLACTKEVNAPLETRIQCKLNNQYSCTLMLIDFLAVKMKHKTVQDLIAALKAIKRNDVVRIITSVYPENSTESISDFASSDINSEMIDKMATMLDQKTRVIGYWINLGRKFNISRDKLKEIEYGQFNPALALMEYLYSKQEDLTVRKFYEEVEKLERGDVLKKLHPFLVEHSEELMKDVMELELESDVMRGICVCLNSTNPALKNWRHLAYAFNVPREIYEDFNPEEPLSPTNLLFEWIFANRSDLTVGQLCAALKSIDRNAVVNDLRKYLEERFTGQE